MTLSEKNIFFHNYLEEKCKIKFISKVYFKVEANIALCTYLYLYNNNMNDLYTHMGNFLQLFFLILSCFS